MPNHVTGRLDIIGPRENLESLMAFVKSDDHVIDANKIIPYPQIYRDLDAIHNLRYGDIYSGDARTEEQQENYERDFITNSILLDGFNSGGYEWCCKYWGTKWGFYDDSVGEIVCFDNCNDKYCTLSYKFLTAWSPPRPLIIALSIKYTACTFVLYYEDEGWTFDAGWSVYSDGYVIDKNSFDEVSWKKIVQNYNLIGFGN